MTDAPTLIVAPSSGWLSPRLKELWDYRELLYFLTWREVKVRYKQTALGAAWAVVQPFLTMVVFSVFFGALARMPSDGVPYPVFAYCGLLPWQLFARSLTDSSHSLVANKGLISKVYFPRLALPLSAPLSALLDFGVAFLVLLGMLLYYGISPGAGVLALPLFLLLALATSIGAGMWLSALNVEYRDVQHVIPFLAQLWLFATPVAYPSSLVPEAWRALYGLNPMAGVVEGFRWALLGTTDGPGPLLVVSVLAVVALLVSGVFYFRRVEARFADIL